VDNGLILDKYRWFFAKHHRFFQLGIYFPMKIWWIGSTAHGPARRGSVHGGPRWQSKRARRCLAVVQRAGARAQRCSSVAVEEDRPDEVLSEGCSSEHRRWRWRRGGAIEVKIGSGLSSVRGQKTVRWSLG
jgi:hypothetical protein